jgi:hypothetical protein
MSVTERHHYVVTPRTRAMAAEEIDRVFAPIVAADPGLLGPPDPKRPPSPVSATIGKNGSVVLQIPTAAVDTVKRLLGDQFVIDPSNPLLRHM